MPDSAGTFAVLAVVVGTFAAVGSVGTFEADVIGSVGTFVAADELGLALGCFVADSTVLDYTVQLVGLEPGCHSEPDFVQCLYCLWHLDLGAAQIVEGVAETVEALYSRVNPVGRLHPSLMDLALSWSCRP